MLIGLTGGIGSGKSLVSDALVAEGVVVIDADQIARDVVAVGQSALQQLVQVFGAQILHADGSLNRPLLRRLAFANDGNRQALNAIMHPAIRSALLAAIQSPRQAGEAAYRLLVAPLLLENGLQALVDMVVVVDVAESTQQMRAASRDGTDVQAIAEIMKGQWSRAQRLACAHAVIDNSGTRAATLQQAQCLHRQLTALAHR